MKKLLTRMLALGLALTVCLTVPAFAEGDEASEFSYDMTYYGRFAGQGLSLNVYNWGEYLSDGTDDSLDVNSKFEELTGVNVIYSTFDTNETLYAKLKTGGSSYDIIIPSDYMISRMVEEKLVQPLDFANIPNFSSINPQYVNPSYDPQNLYSVPYTWGTVGMIYNTTMVDPNDPMDSWTVMWSEAYRDNVLMFGNSKDAFGIALKVLGQPLNPSTPDQIEDATKLLKQQKPILQAYVMDEIFDKMTGGEAAIAPYYAGDARTMIDDNPDLAFVIPKEGSNIFTDAICIPQSAKHKELAEMYINFLLEPEIGLANIEYIGYSTPNDAVYALLDEETKNNPIAYPPAEVLQNCEYFNHVSPELALLMDEKWTEILTADEHYNQMIMPMLMLFCLGGILVLNLLRAWRKKRDQQY
ncbi:MAG: spermidine/putrescine ABC transporter substrate-binding protein [Angelakisella sp.]